MNTIKKLSSEELISQLEKVYNKDFIKMTDIIGVDNQSLRGWKKGGIPLTGTTRPYLELLLLNKIKEDKTDEKLNACNDLIKAIDALKGINLS